MGAGDWQERSERKPQSLSWDVIHKKKNKEKMSHIDSVKAIQCDDCTVKISRRAQQMSHWTRALAAKSNDLSLVSRIYMIQRDDQLPMLSLTSKHLL